MRMMSSMVFKNYHRVFDYDLSRQVLKESINAINVGRPSDAVVELIIMTTYGPKNNQATTPLRILIK